MGLNASSAGGATVSVVIVSWNTRHYVRLCLASLERASDRHSLEVIVVDNGSTDGTVEMVRHEFPQVVVVDVGANIGFARGNNVGFQNATGEYVLILNPDTVALDGCIDRLVDFMEANPHAGVVGPWIRDADYGAVAE